LEGEDLQQYLIQSQETDLNDFFQGSMSNIPTQERRMIGSVEMLKMETHRRKQIQRH
jgi:hypothetical protein